MARWRLAALGTVTALAAAAQAGAGNAPGAWVYFDSRETASGPRLSITRPDGSTDAVPASADTVLISYLADRPFGGLARLSVSTDDTNRVLLRFDLPENATSAKAELSLVAHASDKPIREALAVAVHVVTAPWDEAGACWSAAPASENEAAAVLSVAPAGGPLSADVTDAVRRAAAAGAKAVSLLLKARDPIGGPAAAADATLGKDLLAAVGFEPDVATALARAASQRRPVLAVVRAGFDDAAESFPETTLLACALTDPDVLSVIQTRFVRTRVRIAPAERLAERPDPHDTLASLGTSVKETRSPALLVASAQGKLLGRLDAIGTYEPGLVRRFLVGVLAKSDRAKPPADAWEALAAGHDEKAAATFAARRDDEGVYGLARVASLAGDFEKAESNAKVVVAGGGLRAAEARVEAGVALARMGKREGARRLLDAFAAAPSARRDEGRYVLACLLDADGEADAAGDLWRSLSREAPASPWGLRARARLAWPARMREFDAVVASPRPAAPVTSTETKMPRGATLAAVARACAWLVAHQDRDGLWRSPAAESSTQLGITALATRALRRWAADVPAVDREGVDRAVSRADAWLEAAARDADPEAANSFGTAYLLDDAVDRLANDPRAKKHAERAVALVLRAQCGNGGWSYDRTFGSTWKGGFAGWPATTEGRVHSMNTGLSLLSLCRARDAGLAVDAKALERGRDALLSMRSKPGVFTYTFPVPRNFETPDASAARAPLCEHALLLLGAGKAADLRRAVDVFLASRDGLRDVAKLSPSWLPPHAYSSYFVLFAYLHGARAIRQLEGEHAKATLGRLADDLLGCVEADGTWVDYEESGKAYGTAAALLVLDEAWR